jgi:tetratricopeptide (TPR) repeat protein
MVIEAEKVIDTLMKAQQPSTRVRLAYGQVMNYVGFNQLRNSHEEESVRSLQKARDAYRSIDELSLANLPAAVGYAESTAWQIDALASLSRVEEALKIGPEALAVARKVLERRPNHMPALRAHALIAGGLSQIEVERLHMAKAVDLARGNLRDWEAFLKLDPTNTIAWNNLAANHAGITFGLDALGRSDEALVHGRKVIEIARRFPDLKPNFIFAPGRMAVIDAEFGRPSPTAADYRAWAEEIASRAPGTFVAIGMKSIADSFDRAVHLAWERNEQVRDMAVGGYESLLQRKASSLAQERRRDRGLATVAFDAAFAYACLKDHPAAETWARRAVEHMEKSVPRNVNELVTHRQMRGVLAYAIARQGRHEEAAKIVEGDLRYLRDLVARGSDDLGIQFAFAQTLFVAAVATPSAARPLLTEAAGRIDGMPRDMTRRKSVMQLRGWIAEEQRRSAGG